MMNNDVRNPDLRKRKPRKRRREDPCRSRSSASERYMDKGQVTASIRNQGSGPARYLRAASGNPLSCMHYLPLHLYPRCSISEAASDAHHCPPTKRSIFGVASAARQGSLLIPLPPFFHPTKERGRLRPIPSVAAPQISPRPRMSLH